jgi:hypothetical protein
MSRVPLTAIGLAFWAVGILLGPIAILAPELAGLAGISLLVGTGVAVVIRSSLRPFSRKAIALVVVVLGLMTILRSDEASWSLDSLRRILGTLLVTCIALAIWKTVMPRVAVRLMALSIAIAFAAILGLGLMSAALPLSLDVLLESLIAIPSGLAFLWTILGTPPSKTTHAVQETANS